MIIDDDVILPPEFQVRQRSIVIIPLVPQSQHRQIPLQTLRERPEIKAVSFAIQGKTESGKPKLLSSLQDAEYKVVGAAKQLQSKFGTALFCHGAIGLWRRDILGKHILWHHDTDFHGGE